MCQGTTKEGKPCKNKAEPYCSHHKPIAIPALDLPTEHLTTAVQKKLTKYLKQGPTKTDAPGYIYVYYMEKDPDGCYFKIGRTEQKPEKRLKQWEKEIGSKVCSKIWWYVKAQKFMEKMIHRYLDNVRMYRYMTPDGYCSVWKKDLKPVTEQDGELKEKHKLEARKKHIEWFNMPWDKLEPIMLGILKLDTGL